MSTHYDLVARNKRRSFFAILIFIVVICGLSYLLVWADIAPISLLAISFVATGIWSFISYYYSDKIILAYSGAQEADREKYFDFYTVTENLALVAQTPLPKMYVIHDPAPNAFATGRNPEHAVVCVTTGLLEKLDRHELEAVVAHELSHIRHYDILLASLVSILVGTLVMVVDISLRTSRRIKNDGGSSGALALARIFIYILAVLAPILLSLIQLAISRRREYFADAGSVELTQNPEALIFALSKISADPNQLQRVSGATADLYIANPYKKRNLINKISGLFETHPPIEKRIAALEELR